VVRATLSIVCSPDGFELCVSFTAEWQLNISRMVLLDVQLNPPPSSAKQPVQPLLWPMNAFFGFGNGLTLQDVRMAIGTAAFTQHLVFFRSQPTLQGSINPNLHTVRTSSVEP